MQSVQYKLIEFLILFVVYPISLVLEYSFGLKMGFGILGFVYVIFVLLKIEKQQFKMALTLNWRLFWKHTIVKLLVIAVVTTLYMLFICSHFKQAITVAGYSLYLFNFFSLPTRINL